MCNLLTYMYTITNHMSYLPECTGTGRQKQTHTHTHTQPPLQVDKCVRRQGEIINYQANGHQAEFCFIKL